MLQYCLVAIPSPPYATLTYAWPELFPGLTVGQRVLAPMGRSLRVGVVSGQCADPPEGVTIKPVLWPLDRTPLLDSEYLEMVRELAVRQMAEPGRILEILLPAKLRASEFTFEVDVEGFPRIVKPRALASMDEERLRILARAWESGAMRVRRMGGDEDHVSLAADPPWRVRPNARRQLAALEHLLEHGPTPRSVLSRVVGDSGREVIDGLARHGLVSVGPLPEDMAPETPAPASCAGEMTLTEGQREALERLLPALQSPEPETCLLHGITGSGKTHVYFELAEACLNAGKSALILAPEVALANQLWNGAVCRFPGRNPLFYHGYQPPGLRERRFLELAESREPSLVIGARSALFLPLPNLGLIVLDEEHDESFKQEERLSYQAKEVAWFRVKSAGGLLVLGSATPDIKTFQAANQGHIPIMSMPERTGAAVLPEVKLVDISNLSEKDVPFARETRDSLKATVKAGDQAIILLNRRGYSPLMYCRSCQEEGVSERGAVVRCPHCDVGMTYHKARSRLVCHYCGQVKHWPLVCESCGGSVFLPLGEGTERLEERLAGLLPPETSILRLDRDSARRQERMEDILARFSSGEAQVLVGTQMLSKGHHFPGVTLVAAADGDLGLNMPDYRSMERTFQLLVQVSGRAGRGYRPGRVLIQTRNPGNPFWEHVINGDYLGFFNREIELRRKYRYPPFVKLGLIRISHPSDEPRGGEELGAVSEAIRRAAMAAGVMALGPAPAPLGLLRGRKRFNCLLKASDWPSIRQVFAEAVHALPRSGSLRLGLDLDPVNMM